MRTLSLTALASILLLAGGSADAQECTSVEEFNARMDQQLSSADDVTLSFTVTGVNLDDYFNGKGWLAELLDSSCAGGGSAALKVYGNSDPVNGAHPPGTVKLEYGSFCCADGGCPVERWADPNPGEPIFSQGGQVCSIVMRVAPSIVSYDIQCDGGATFHGEGGNPDGLTVTRVALLSEVSGGHAMDNATILSEEICFVAAGQPADTQTYPVVEDVTVASYTASVVYEWVDDLACGLSDGWIYLKFDLSNVAGRLNGTTLFIHSSDDPSADGAGGNLVRIGDNGWSENTLTWDARPAPGATLGRIEGVDANRWYSVDLSAEVRNPGIYSFALIPGDLDENASHFFSKEASATLMPYLQAQVEVVDADADGVPAGPDCDDGAGGVYPGAGEACDGIDNDCSGLADEGCGVEGGDDDGDDGDDGDEPGYDDVDDGLDEGVDGGGPGGAPGAVPLEGGCACRASGAPAPATWLLAITGLFLALRRRTPRRMGCGTPTSRHGSR